MEAAQAAALEMLKERQDALGERARIIWHERFETSQRKLSISEAPDVTEGLEHATFFTELRHPDRLSLRREVWPASRADSERDRFREQQQRAQVLATAARLGHSLIDLYVLTILRLGGLEQRTLEAESEDGGALERRRIDEYLDVLDKQRVTPVGDRDWGAFDELALISRNFDLILDANAPEARDKPLVETARYFGSILRQQQPVGGMSGHVNKTVVQQFRMPGYPFILITTDLLQEGEDLHTFCSSVYHYGISWTPSSMEQRIGRIDRVRSQSDRRLSGLEAIPDGAELLQVYYPHLEDTVEVLQVQRVLARMNTFLRLMHEGFSVPSGDHRSVDVGREVIDRRRAVETICGQLRTGFPILSWALQGGRQELATDDSKMAAMLERFKGLSAASYRGLVIEWERASRVGTLWGTVTLANGRARRLALQLKSDGEWMVVRCVSNFGRVDLESKMMTVEENALTRQARIGAILGREEAVYDLTIEDDVLLGDPPQDVRRVTVLLNRVVEQSEILEQIHLPFLDKHSLTRDSELQHEEGARRD
jgi:hypothetical protein